MTGLADHLRRRIDLEGPLTVAQYMEEALGHPRLGYYMGRDPLGRAGDFITAPEISQMFGELIGAWCAAVWQAMGRPDPVNLVELGPGRGTLMADALRAARTASGFADAVRVHMVETSPAFRARQAAALKGVKPAPTWHDDFSQVPDGPLILVANEFFDALPVRQFVRTERGWCERLVGLDRGRGGFAFVLSEPLAATPLIPPAMSAGPPGTLVEVSPARVGLGYAVGKQVARFGGAGLVIDYGHGRSGAGDTLQAVKGHAYHDVLGDPGAADLTAHVDFEALAGAARQAGARVLGAVPQGAFLERLGLGARAEALIRGATPPQARAIEAARHRLAAPDQMGALFKVLAISHPGLAEVPGFS